MVNGRETRKPVFDRSDNRYLVLGFLKMRYSSRHRIADRLGLGLVYNDTQPGTLEFFQACRQEGKLDLLAQMITEYYETE